MQDYKTYIELALAVVFIIVGGLGMGWFRILKETNSLLKEQNAELKIANKELLEKHNDNVQQLASMQGQIDVLKSIPLVNIDSTLKQIAKFNKLQANINSKILRSLESSATVLARDTENAAGAARKVKTDLIESNKQGENNG